MTCTPSAQLSQHSERVGHRPVIDDPAILEATDRDPVEAHPTSAGHDEARLHFSQSAVSQQISALEKGLGVMLVERIGRRVL